MTFVGCSHIRVQKMLFVLLYFRDRYSACFITFVFRICHLAFVLSQLYLNVYRHIPFPEVLRHSEKDVRLHIYICKAAQHLLTTTILIQNIQEINIVVVSKCCAAMYIRICKLDVFSKVSKNLWKWYILLLVSLFLNVNRRLIYHFCIQNMQISV